ncbi:MAG: NAD(P)H-hydrate dehydratase [Syntrophomonadaceae bacterium]|nr:NAD(P)H-hydrate dehydratase [Syntrophomonadaceae bacterium]
MKIVSARQMREIDRQASEEFHIPSLILMENAGLRVVEAVETALKGVGQGKVVVLAGKGNNGGDGLVAARHLLNAGTMVDTFLVGEPAELTPDTATNYRILSKLTGRIFPLTREEHLENLAAALLTCDLVVDAIYGIGFHGEMPPLEARVVGLVNRTGKPVVAVDIPSGVEADTGKVHGEAIKATWTVTLALPKMAFFSQPGRSYAGTLTVADISIPSNLLEDSQLKDNLITEEMIRPLFTPRRADTHKGSYGHVLVVGGSIGLTGAVIMTSQAALKSGAGLVTAAIPSSLQPVVETRLVEVMTVPLAENVQKAISLEALPALENLLGAVSVCAVGPGMGRYDEASGIIRFILERAGVPVVIDADGLNALADDISILRNRQVPVILTPHPGEMARLTGLSVAEIQANRVENARRFAEEWGVTLVLKGHNTVVATPRGEAYINITGNPGMATAGSGDVLCGIMAGLLAQGSRPHLAAIAGVYVHGKAGDLARASKGERGLVALDLVDAVPDILKEFESI